MVCFRNTFNKCRKQPSEKCCGSWIWSALSWLYTRIHWFVGHIIINIVALGNCTFVIRVSKNAVISLFTCTILFLLVQGGGFQFIMWSDKSKATVSYQWLGQCIWCSLEKTWFCEVNGYHSFFVEFCLFCHGQRLLKHFLFDVFFFCLLVIWHCFYRRLDNNMNIYKGVVQRAQLQLARFQVNILSNISLGNFAIVITFQSELNIFKWSLFAHGGCWFAWT